ncbi:unnamed protein product [Linum trigynum]|uniref:Reverse transcriptase Ty1/copia-type domain-containing protein n=1 Tax=Linum trigynum TaxID=586398 RepID=A0AAV2FQN9_9ROSI
MVSEPASTPLSPSPPPKTPSPPTAPTPLSPSSLPTGSISSSPSSSDTSSLSPPIIQATPASSSTSPSPSSPLRRYPDRVRQAPQYLSDYECQLHSVSAAKSPKFPMTSYMSYDCLTPDFQSFVLNISQVQEPRTFEEACTQPCWQQAMNSETSALIDNHTSDIVSLPPWKKVVGNSWVYKIKFNPNGTIERHRARLVAKGFTQKYGVDYLETFSPVAKLNTVKTLLAVGAIKNWFMDQLDVSNAFLNGDLDEEVYMSLPPGFPIPESIPNPVCRLNKSLYGLKQASRQWYFKLTSALLEYGFSPSHSDHSMFVKGSGDSFLVILVYVDDMIVAGPDQHLVSSVKTFLQGQFKIRDLGPLRYFLGLEIARNTSGLMVTQRKNCLELLKDAGLTDCKPVRTPMDIKVWFTTSDGEPLKDITQFRSLIGRLHYLTITRPDICFVVQQLSQFQMAPTTVHLKAAIRVLKYLKNSPGQGLFFSSSSSLQLYGYSDSGLSVRTHVVRSRVIALCLELL